MFPFLFGIFPLDFPLIRQPRRAPDQSQGNSARISRHWWRILGLWLVVSAPIAFLIYLFIQPTYEASSLLRIEPAVPDILSPLNRSPAENQSSTYLGPKWV